MRIMVPVQSCRGTVPDEGERHAVVSARPTVRMQNNPLFALLDAPHAHTMQRSQCPLSHFIMVLCQDVTLPVKDVQCARRIAKQEKLWVARRAGAVKEVHSRDGCVRVHCQMEPQKLRPHRLWPRHDQAIGGGAACLVAASDSLAACVCKC